VDGVKVLRSMDRTFFSHEGGKIEIKNKLPVRDRNDLSKVYTPGVARVCMDIHHHKEHAYRYTIKGNAVAIVSDGTAVLGLGDIGPEAALPVTGNVEQVGWLLYTTYLVPFEVASMLLLVAMIGAIILAKREL